MKKIYFFAALAAVALASCSNDETVAEYQGDAISFRPLMENVTRAANGTGLKSTWETGDILYVTAQRGTAKYFQDQFVKDESGFNSSNKHYWPSDITSTNLTFFAFWGAAQKTWAADGDGNYLATAYTVPDEVASQKDLLFAKQVAATKPADGGQTLNFRHMLSQIYVKVANDQPNLKITITGVRVGYLKKTGSFIYTGTATDTKETGSNNATKIARTDWTLDATAVNAVSRFQQNVTTTELSGSTTAQAFSGNFSPWILMPQELTAASNYTENETDGVKDDTKNTLNGAYIALKMSMVDATTDVPIVAEQWCYWPIGTTWNPGYKYTYTVNAGSGGYQPTDQDNDGELDPVLDKLTIWFQPTCTIDEWVSENYGISAPISRTASYAFGTNQTINLEAGANGAYDITITGLTEGHVVTASATGNFTAVPTVSNGGNVPANGTVSITGDLAANTNAAGVSVITITHNNGTSGDATDDVSMTITINQAAPTE